MVDEKDFEFIYKRCTKSYINIKDNPSNVDTDGYVDVKLGWTHTPKGINDDYPYEFSAVRYKNNGIWDDWSKPKLFNQKINIKTGRKPTEYLNFDECRDFVRKLGLQSCKEWLAYSKSGNRPINVPCNPSEKYKNAGWISFSDFLGYKNVMKHKELTWGVNWKENEVKFLKDNYKTLNDKEIADVLSCPELRVGQKRRKLKLSRDRIYKGRLIEELDDLAVVEFYLQEGSTLRSTAKHFESNHKRIGRILERNKIEIKVSVEKPEPDPIVRKNNHLLANMVAHLRFNVDIDWAKQYDFGKLKTLNKAIRSDRVFDTKGMTQIYKDFIAKFHDCDNFNTIYNRWVESDYDKYLAPSLDHIIPKSKGGTDDLNNMRFLTWLENRCKTDIDQSQWDYIKANLNKYFI